MKYGKRSLAEAERYFRERLSGVVTGLLPAYYEKLNEQIVEDKAGRREAGLQVERHGDKRTILTTLGQVEYRRTYYRTKMNVLPLLQKLCTERGPQRPQKTP